MAGLLACCFGGPEPGPAESEVKSEAVAAVAAAASKVPAAAQPKEAATPKPPGVPVAAPEPEPEPEEPEEALAMVEEPACGHLYPSFITAYAGAAGRPKQKLVGCGVRSKRIGGNLYTVGVYVAPASRAGTPRSTHGRETVSAPMSHAHASTARPLGGGASPLNASAQP